MMSRTHIAVGVASALLVAPTGSIGSACAAVIGGSLGGIIADCDITPSKAHRDALVGRLLVAAIAAGSLAIDHWLDAGICDYLVGHLGMRLVAGVVLFCALTFAGSHTDHRSLTHSLLAMAAFCLATHLACGPLLPYFAMGYASHLLLDLTNTRGIRLLYPSKRTLGLGWCSAKGRANDAALVLGIAAATLLLVYRVGSYVGLAITFT